MKKVVCMDSDYDSVSKLVADWRRNNLYPSMSGNGHTVEILKENLATRMYLEKGLKTPEVVFFTASGHGLPDEFQGNDGFAALKVSEYNASEVQNKIVHLLSCNTAFELGGDIVINGGSAFFGYDIPFSFYKEHIDLYMAPDAELARGIINGQNAQEVHDLVSDSYKASIDELQNKAITQDELQRVTDMMTNFAHFCSPVKSSQWGSVSARI